MNARCADCDTHFLIGPDTVVSGACPNCGGKRLERDQPSPTHSDGELRNMVNPDTGQDMGGNPLMEGVWGSMDNGWRPMPKRDESFAKVADSMGKCPECSMPLQPWGVNGARCAFCGHTEGERPTPTHMFEPGTPIRYHNPNGYTEDDGTVYPDNLHGAEGYYMGVDPSYAGAAFVNFPGRHENWVMHEHLMPRDAEDDPTWHDFWHGAAVNTYEASMNPYERTSNMDPYDHWLSEPEPVQKTAGPLVGLAGGFLADTALPFLMRGALMGTGSHMIQGLLPGQQQQQQGGPSVAPTPLDPARDPSVFSHTAAGVDGGEPVETPTSNPGYFHDDPEAIDQGEFNDGAIEDPNIEQPNVDAEAGGAMTDNPLPSSDQNQLRLDENHPALQRANMLLPLLMDYHNREESGASDPMIRELHEMLKGEWGDDYLNKVGPEHAHAFETWKAQQKTPPGVHARTAAPGFAPGMGMLPGSPAPNQLAPTMQPGGGVPGVGQEGHCPYCGGVQDADGSCPQCGARAPVNDMTGPQMNGPMTNNGGPQQLIPTPQYSHTANGPAEQMIRWEVERLVAEGWPPELAQAKAERLLSTMEPDQGFMGPQPGQPPRGTFARVGAGDTQGPQTPEQILAVQDLLHATNRDQEIPLVRSHPGMFVREMAEIAQRANIAPNLEPGQQPTPPPMDPSMMGGPPGMPPGGGGPGMPPPMSHTAADNIARRCPRCHSATTGVINRNGDCRCHSCHHVWNEPKAVLERMSATPYGDFKCPTCHGAGCPACNYVGYVGGERNVDGPMLLNHDQSDDIYNPEIHPPQDIMMRYPGHDDFGFDPQALQPVPYTHDPRDLRRRLGPQLNDPRWGHTAAGGEPDSSAIQGVPAPDGEDPRDAQDPNEPPSTVAFQDTTGQPLQEGGQYELHSDRFQIPDKIRVDMIKPDEILAHIIDGPEGNQMKLSTKFLQTYGATFQPLAAGDSDAGDQSLQEYQDSGQAPVFTEPVQSNFQRFAPLSEYDKYFGGESGAAAKAKAAMIKQYGEKKGEEVFYATVNKKKKSSEDPTDHCPICTSEHIASSMSSPTSEFHECYRCGHAWETMPEALESDADAATRAWIMESSNDDFSMNMERMAAMRMAANGGSRNIRDIAADDDSYQRIKSHLNNQPKLKEALAGRHFSPSEQRDLISESGVARNADLLDLEDTHYEAPHPWDTKGNAYNVPDEHLFLGL